eukprot:XP_008183470.1 PREDICTED: uncharacterized protein LOC100573842 [Acyrthosiphon pisum]
MKKFIQTLITDKLKKDMEILADKSAFDELLTVEKAYFGNFESFNSNHRNGHMVLTGFNTMYSRSNMATMKSVHNINNDDNVYQYEVQLNSMRIGCVILTFKFYNSNGQSLGVVSEELTKVT